MGAAAAYDSGSAIVAGGGRRGGRERRPRHLEQSVRALRPGGRLVVCGGTSGQRVEISLPRLFFKQYEIIGSTMGSYQEFDEVTALVAQGVDVRVDRTYPLTEYPAALARLEQGEQLGKIVLLHGTDPEEG